MFPRGSIRNSWESAGAPKNPDPAQMKWQRSDAFSIQPGGSPNHLAVSSPSRGFDRTCRKKHERNNLSLTPPNRTRAPVGVRQNTWSGDHIVCYHENHEGARVECV